MAENQNPRSPKPNDPERAKKEPPKEEPKEEPAKKKEEAGAEQLHLSSLKVELWVELQQEQPPDHGSLPKRKAETAPAASSSKAPPAANAAVISRSSFTLPIREPSSS